LLCYTEYMYNCVVSLCFTHNEMSSIKKKIHLYPCHHRNPFHRSAQKTSHHVAQFPSVSCHLRLFPLAQLPCTPLPKSHQTLQNTNCIIWPHICLTNYSNTNYNALNFQFIKETIQRAHQNLVVGRPNTCERSAACRRKRETFSKRTLFACTTAVSHDPQIFSFIPLAFNIHIKTSGRETL